MYCEQNHDVLYYNKVPVNQVSVEQGQGHLYKISLTTMLQSDSLHPNTGLIQSNQELKVRTQVGGFEPRATGVSPTISFCLDLYELMGRTSCSKLYHAFQQTSTTRDQTSMLHPHSGHAGGRQSLLSALTFHSSLAFRFQPYLPTTSHVNNLPWTAWL